MHIPQGYEGSIHHTLPPDWATEFPVDFTSSPAEERSGGGIRDLLVDIQHNLEDQTKTTRMVRLLVTPGGVQQGSRFQIHFSPLLEQLFFHSLILRRGGTASDLLADQEIQVLQREEDLEGHIFSGSLTVVVLLKDTRAGDIIEISYSIRALPGPLSERSTGVFVLKGNTAARLARWRLLYGPERLVHATALNHTLQPTVSYTEAGLVDCQWEIANQRPLLFEEHAPSWHLPVALVQYGEYGSWNEVAEWASRLFHVPEETSAEFHEIVQGIAARATTPEQRICEALRFVQEQIRYVSVSTGEHSMRPYDVATILERRYGDCKDKSSLLGSMLRALGVDAQPALVHSNLKHQVMQWLPSPRAFNHVIARVRSGEKTWWLDPTLPGQRGSLDKIFCPPYGKALVVSPETEALEDVISSGGRHGGLKIVESFKIHQLQAPAEFSASFLYSGAPADAMRHHLANATQEQIGYHFLERYRPLYPQIETAHPWVLRDDESNNRLEVIFSYRINQLWQEIPAQPGFMGAFFYATGIHYGIDRPPQGVRQSPFAIAFPNNIENELLIRTTQPLNFQRGQVLIENETFRFKGQTDVVSNSVHFRMNYSAHRDHVMPGGMKDYGEAIHRVSGLVQQGIMLPSPWHRAGRR